jgi:hypothetical protein
MDHRLALLVAVIACGGGEKAPPPPDQQATPATPAAIAAAPPDSGVAGTTSVTHRARPGAPQAALRAVEATAQPGYDRVVFEFAGDSVPGYHVEYAPHTTTVRRCGSGDPVTVQGAGQLIVRFEPARAHDDQGQPVVERERTLGLPALTEMKLICDFEGQVEFVIGVTTATVPSRVSTQGPPARIILEVRHAP